MALTFSKRSINEASEIKFDATVGRDIRFGAPSDTRKQAVVNIPVVVSRSWPVKDSNPTTFEQVSQWYDVAAWGEQANRLQGLQKNDVVTITCNLADLITDPYVAKDGTSAASIKIQRANVYLRFKASAVQAQPAPADEITF